MTGKIRGEYVKKLLKEGKRVDGRGLLDSRPITVLRKAAKKAEGSAMVTLGDTQVLVGVKLSTGEPYPDTPDEGVLVVNAELVPVASPDFMPGPPNENAVELARVVDRGIRESKSIDTKKLCITPKEKVWMVNTDIHVMNDGGNLIDAAALAAVISLRDCNIPSIDKEGETDYGKSTGKISFEGIPITTTIAKIDGSLVVDPTLEEEKVSECRLTVTVMGDKICALQKGGSGGFFPEEVEQMIGIAFGNAEKLMPIIEEG